MGLIKKVKKIKEVASDPAGAAGVAVGGIVAGAGHPYLAAAAAKGTEKVVKKGIELAKDPEVQKKAKKTAGKAADAVKGRITHFKAGRGE